MLPLRSPTLAVLVAALAAVVLGGCATRPVNPPLALADSSSGYRLETRETATADDRNIVILAFSGGGTRAAAFSYGALEFLARTEIAGSKGGTARLLDQVVVITGVSGGSFTALAYGLYGEQLFTEYEKRFLKRNVQREITLRTLNPLNWPRLWSTGYGRSELASELYDEILFNNATFGDLQRKRGPLIVASATDISAGARFVFTQSTFDIICSDLAGVKLSRAAAASSAVPVVLTPITLNNYGGSCERRPPVWVTKFTEADEPPRPAARAIRALRAQESLANGKERPFLHLVDGGVSDNVGMRGVLDALEVSEALQDSGVPTPIGSARRIIVLIVNSKADQPTDWDKSEDGPGTASVLLKSAGVPIDHFSYEAIELLKDTAARWKMLGALKRAASPEMLKDPKIRQALSVPQAEVYAIDVSFDQLKDKAEVAYLNQQPTSFVLTDEAVDRLRAAAGRIIADSPEFQRLLKDIGSRVLQPAPPPPAASPK